MTPEEKLKEYIQKRDGKQQDYRPYRIDFRRQRRRAGHRGRLGKRDEEDFVR